jgi:hypothetical protein
MKKTILAALLISAAAPAFADDKPTIQKDGPPTVAEMIGAGVALRELSAKDKDGKPLYHFQSSVMFDLLTDEQQADLVQKLYADSYKALVDRVYGGQKAVNDVIAKVNECITQNKNAEKDPKVMAVVCPVDAHADEFTAEMKKVQDKPAPGTIVKIKKTDLCLAAHDPECPVANPITIETLKQLWPILEK